MHDKPRTDGDELGRLVGQMIDLALELCDPYEWDVSVNSLHPMTVMLRLAYRHGGKNYGARMIAGTLPEEGPDRLRIQVMRTVRDIRKELEANP